MIEHRIELMDLDSIEPSPMNPKNHDDAGIAESIDEHGLAEIPMVDDRTGWLEAGHGRIASLRARRAQGLAPPDGVTVEDGRWLVPVLRGWASRDAHQAERYLIASNQLTMNGGWRSEDLAERLAELQATEPGLAGTGYTADTLEELLASVRTTTVHEHERALPRYKPEPPAPRADVPVVQVLVGDCVAVMATMAGASVDAIVTDPPYEIGFMGKSWDEAGVAFAVATWAEALRVLKPGGHLLAFGGTRTYHRMVVAIEDAGFEIRDSIDWVYGSGFPKSMDVSLAIDKHLGADGDRAVVGSKTSGIAVPGECPRHTVGGSHSVALDVTTAAAAAWKGWGTALKPAHEPIVVARKPPMGPVAVNVLEHGTGGLNVAATRVEGGREREQEQGSYSGGGPVPIVGARDAGKVYGVDLGRWPANWLLTHAVECDDQGCVEGCPVADLDIQSGSSTSRRGGDLSTPGSIYGGGDGLPSHTGVYGFDDEGGASRFFPVFRYEAKPSTAERNAGLEELPEVWVNDSLAEDALGRNSPRAGAGAGRLAPQANIHPTVKPLALMRWLVRLVTPPGGTILEPFTGSGTTLAAAVLEGFDAIGIEKDEQYVPLIEGRVAWAQNQRSET